MMIYKKTLIKPLVICVSVLLIISSTIYITRYYWLKLAAHVLIKDNQPIKGADAILMLLGNLESRTQYTADLYKQGYAPKILFAKSQGAFLVKQGIIENEAAIAKRLLIKFGVPLQDIVVIDSCSNQSTVDEARCFLNFMIEQKLNIQRAVVITSWYHSRRAAWIYNKIFADQAVTFEFSPSPTTGYSYQDWWQSEAGFLIVFNEYLKWIYYLSHY